MMVFAETVTNSLSLGAYDSTSSLLTLEKYKSLYSNCLLITKNFYQFLVASYIVRYYVKASNFAT